MAKRVRGKRSAYRPGGQGPSRTRETESAERDVRSPDIDAIIDASGEPIEVAPSETPVAAPAVSSRKAKTARRSARARAESLEGRAAAEESWVRADLRSITLISVALIVALAIAWVLFVAMDVASLY